MKEIRGITNPQAPSHIKHKRTIKNKMTASKSTYFYNGYNSREEGWDGFKVTFS